MKISNLCVIILVIVLLFHMCTCNHSTEQFGSGAQVQLMTSRPYYGWYDYWGRMQNAYPRRMRVGRGHRRGYWGYNRWPMFRSRWW